MVLPALQRKHQIIFAIALLASITTGMLATLEVNPTLVFFVAAGALASLAATVGEATDQLGNRLSPVMTGVLQSAIGNLPELFVGIFALQAGLVTVVQTAIVGSILANSLLVLGLAFLMGGLRFGELRFDQASTRVMVTLTILAVSALIVPTLAAELHTPAGGHEVALSLLSAIILLIVFVSSIVFIARRSPAQSHMNATQPLQSRPQPEAPEQLWPLWMTLAILVAAGVGAALVSDWFVDALKPAITTLNISEAFAGLVIVAIAGNAVENVVGIQLAMQNTGDLAVSVVLNSSLQVAIALTPILVLVSFFLGGTPLTLQLPPLLVAALVLAVLLDTVIVLDGEANWLEGTALIGLYAIIATSFWWG
jgi:Ca2+:H+ antiporter